MAWRIDLQPNGKLACFSEVSDDFVFYDMSHQQAVNLCMARGCSSAEAVEKVQRGLRAGLNRWGSDIAIVGRIHGWATMQERIVAQTESRAARRERRRQEQRWRRLAKRLYKLHCAFAEFQEYRGVDRAFTKILLRRDFELAIERKQLQDDLKRHQQAVDGLQAKVDALHAEVHSQRRRAERAERVVVVAQEWRGQRHVYAITSLLDALDQYDQATHEGVSHDTDTTSA